THVFPMAANPGQVIDVELVGSAKAVHPRARLQAPTSPGLQQIQLDFGGRKSNPAAFIVSSLPQVTEHEPNDTPQQANRIALPCGISGRIGAKRDLDHFVFAAKKGKAIRLEVNARRFGTPLQSSLDSVIDVMNAKGQVLASNDDTFGKDAALTFTPPAAGDYLLRVRDLNSKGGDTAVYYVEADYARPDFTLRCDPDKAMIGPGSSTAWYVHIARSGGFDGPVKIDVTGLPKGVTVNPLTIPATMAQGLLVLTAAADAPRDGANVQIVGTASAKTPAGAEKSLIRSVTPDQEIYMPGGGRSVFGVKLQTVAVTEPSDILKVNVSPQTI